MIPLKSKITLPIIAILMIVFGILLGFNIRGSSTNQSQEASIQSNFIKFQEVLRLVAQNYFEEVDDTKMVDDAIIGMLKELDPHTFYITSDEMKQISEQMQGSFDGIGIEFNILEDTLYVVSPIYGGPSDKLGIQTGDRIVKIDGELVAGIGLTNSDVVKKLRGPKGSKVKVTILRKGIKKLLDFEIIRDKIPITSVDYGYMVDDEIGYIKVSRFAETTVNEFSDKLDELKSQGLKHLILDLRGNPGGYLDKAKTMVDMFLDKNKLIVYTKGRIPSSNNRYVTSPDVKDFEEGGLIVLTNQGSASASEIVSGAVQDWDRGLVVGTRTFGKGLVQQQYALSDGSAIRVVVSRYYTPSGRCIQKPYTSDESEYKSEVYERYESGELFDPSKIEFPDSLKFETSSGRIVYGGGGIMPDVYIPTDTTGTSSYLTDLVIKGIFRTFSYHYAEENAKGIQQKYKDYKEYVEYFEIDQQLIDEFVAYASEKEVPYLEADFVISEKYIKNNIKAILGRTLYNDDGFYPVSLSIDPTFQKALTLMPDAIKLHKTGKFKYKN